MRGVLEIAVEKAKRHIHIAKANSELTHVADGNPTHPEDYFKNAGHSLALAGADTSDLDLEILSRVQAKIPDAEAKIDIARIKAIGKAALERDGRHTVRLSSSKSSPREH